MAQPIDTLIQPQGLGVLATREAVQGLIHNYVAWV